MTDQEINMEIAKYHGWTSFKEVFGELLGIPPYLNRYIKIPYFFADLNAMHETEKCLLKMDNSLAYWETYSNRLVNMLGTTDVFHATARQRAEAFLKTINKWKYEDNG